MRWLGLLLVVVGAVGLAGLWDDVSDDDAPPLAPPARVSTPLLVAGMAVTVGLIILTVGGRRPDPS